MTPRAVTHTFPFTMLLVRAAVTIDFVRLRDRWIGGRKFPEGEVGRLRDTLANTRPTAAGQRCDWSSGPVKMTPRLSSSFIPLNVLAVL